MLAAAPRRSQRGGPPSPHHAISLPCIGDAHMKLTAPPAMNNVQIDQLSERLTVEWLARRLAMWLLSLGLAVGGACALYSSASDAESRASNTTTHRAATTIAVTSDVGKPDSTASAHH